MRLIRSSELSPQSPTEQTRRILESVSEESLRSWVEKIAVPRNFYAQREQNQLVAHWLTGQLAEWGYSVQNQGPFSNVVALPRESSANLLLVGAHYDSVPQTPGADDNGSAVAAMLACAQVLATLGPSPPVCFVAFNAEENDLAGSKDFVANFLPQAGFRIRQAHILEMVGFASPEPGTQKTPTGLPIRIPETGDFLGLLADEGSATALESILSKARTYLPAFQVIGLEAPLGVERVFPVLARSDHVPFWHHRIPALMWTDTSEFRNPHYHRATDTPATLDYAFLRKVAQLLVACVTEQAVR